MWNRASSNKYLQQISKQQAYRKHISTLYHIKSTIDNRAPKKYSFLTTRPKAQIKKQQRQSQIDRTNNILVDKMLNNPSSVKMSKNSKVYTKQSLNSGLKKKNNKQIDTQNQRLVNKLQTVGSEYSKNKVLRATQNYQRLKSTMAHSRMDISYDLMSGMLAGKNSIQRSRRRPRTAKN